MRTYVYGTVARKVTVLAGGVEARGGFGGGRGGSEMTYISKSLLHRSIFSRSFSETFYYLVIQFNQI